MQMASQRVKNFVSLVDCEEEAQALKFRFTYFNEILYHIIKRRQKWSITFYDVINIKINLCNSSSRKGSLFM